MNIKVAGVVVAVIVLLIRVVERSKTLLSDSMRGGDTVWWFPQLESAGQTVSVYFYLVDLITFLMAVPLIALLGYRVGQSLDVSQAYQRIIGAFAVGGSVGYIVGTMLIWQTIPSVAGLPIIAGLGAATGIQFALIGLSGAALAEFDAGLPSRGQSTETTTSTVDTRSD